MNELINRASSSSPHYASSKKSWVLSETLYSFAQCTPDIDSFGCNSCLRSALSHITEYCGNSLSAVGFMPSCQLRYATSAFLNDPVHTGQESKKGRLTMTIIIAIAICVSVGLIVLGFVVWICVRRRKPKEANSTPSTSSFALPPATASPNGLRDGTGSSFGDTQCVQYDFNTLKIATRDFSAETMLGEGGFGIVYKGTLANGQHLAIKRLTGSPSGQGAREFMTEARLLAKLQHKNLVRLLGFCSEGDEKLLVYEFMSNASVDRFLFDPRNRHLFYWASRYKIIMGIARGLQYLHEDSRLTIIHRDLKPGNILLDNEMNPKITDFGLARLFEGAQKSANTARIVGTQGYMAPEYLMTGDYSDKSDVYSFGIMLLEIVSGQKNRIPKEFPQKEDLSIQAWSLWNEGRSFELTDPIMSNNCPSYEVMRCIQIGLLCVQANADERPIMTAVVLMLTGSIDLPFPSTPAMLTQQYSTRTSHSGPQPSDLDQVSTKSSFSVQIG
ncbi:cysteine-rich receptor-like protein kinase 25 [Silene latifolia]|uniref:cysteine-rich receptor-like protein kinase 25 n=1 Tax=Silene latifolia TaxID=37657 RepID=UPI003D78A4B0